MKMRIVLLSLMALCLILAAVPAMAQYNCPANCYDNGPVNGQVDAWTINNGFAVSDSFHLANETEIQNISFWAWVEPGDTATSVEVAIGTTPFNNDLLDETGVGLTQSDCFTNNFGFDICHESGNLTSFVQPGAGNYWLTLENATTSEVGPLYWDENSGVNCTSPGCPSTAQENTLGSIPSEAFTVSGVPSPGTTPEPGSIILLGSGILGLSVVLRRKLF
jgi:PEP-CTERM motif